jgi:hypothetical protein
MTSRSLLAHVVSRFAPRQWENVATESLRYLLARPGAATAVVSLVAPLGFDPGPVTWRGQAGSVEDSSIPDLVGDDGQRRHVLIVEGKFWAELTANQPSGYLHRQASQFPDDPGAHLLLFLVPERREQLIAAELEARLGAPRARIGPYQVIDRDGRRVLVVTWAQMLAHVKTALEAAGDRDGLDDLAQLRGLCDRADAEAMLPISPEEIGSDRGHRVYEFCDLVDRVTDLLVADGTVDTKGLKATAAKGWYGRYVRSRSGHVFLIGMLAWSWGHQYPTPFWVRFGSRAARWPTRSHRLMDIPDFPLSQRRTTMCWSLCGRAWVSKSMWSSPSSPPPSGLCVPPYRQRRSRRRPSRNRLSVGAAVRDDPAQN